jgi:ATP-dependent Clp protease, protease subunit
MEVEIKGTIIPNDDKWIYDWFEMDSTCPKDIRTVISSADKTDKVIDVKINSGGGDVIAGVEIKDMLETEEKKGRAVNVHIAALAASAATIPATVGHCTMNASAIYMIHNASARYDGDYRTHDKASGILQTVDKAISAAYQAKTGLDEKKLKKCMDDETWMTAEDALKNGFIDEVLQSTAKESAEAEAPIKLVATVATESMISAKIIEHMRAHKNDFLPQAAAENKNDEAVRRARAGLELVKIGGKKS